MRTTFITGMFVNMAVKAGAYVARSFEPQNLRAKSRRRYEGKEALKYVCADRFRPADYLIRPARIPAIERTKVMIAAANAFTG